MGERERERVCLTIKMNVFNAVSPEATDKEGGIKRQIKYPKRVMVLLSSSKCGLTSPIVFKLGETLSHNYTEVVLLHAPSEGERLLKR